MWMNGAPVPRRETSLRCEHTEDTDGDTTEASAPYARTQSPRCVRAHVYTEEAHTSHTPNPHHSLETLFNTPTERESAFLSTRSCNRAKPRQASPTPPPQGQGASRGLRAGGGGVKSPTWGSQRVPDRTAAPGVVGADPASRQGVSTAAAVPSSSETCRKHPRVAGIHAVGRVPRYNLTSKMPVVFNNYHLSIVKTPLRTDPAARAGTVFVSRSFF